MALAADPKHVKSPAILFRFYIPFQIDMEAFSCRREPLGGGRGFGAFLRLFRSCYLPDTAPVIVLLPALFSGASNLLRKLLKQNDF